MLKWREWESFLHIRLIESIQMWGGIGFGFSGLFLDCTSMCNEMQLAEDGYNFLGVWFSTSRAEGEWGI